MPTRIGAEDDLPEIVRIYNQSVEATTATFDVDAATVEDRRPWFRRFSDQNPIYVCDLDGHTAGFAFYLPYRPKPAYENTVELSLYVDRECHGRGVGSALMECLVKHAGERSVHVLIGVIAGDNPVSVALHEKFGFEKVGHLREVGRKFGAWVDTAFYQKILRRKD